MRQFLFGVLVFLFNASAQAGDTFAVLSYHDVKDAVPRDAARGITAVSEANLIAHFEWLRDHHYQVVSIQDVLDAQAHRKSLPDKAVLLTFDDGYASFYSRVFPLLKRFHYPATLALVGKWMEVEPGGMVAFSESEQVPRSDLLSWEHVKEVTQSGLVEVASHSHDAHHGILGNPQGNTQPSLVTRRFDSGTQRYENDNEYLDRIRQELRASADTLERRLGKRPRVMVWPYGAYSRLTIAAAADAGMPITMSLRDGINDVANLSAVKRFLVAENPSAAELAQIFEDLRADRAVRVAHVDLDYIYDPNPERTERNLDKLLDRLWEIAANTVYLQAFADPDGDGNADALYFPNRHLPMRSDLFNRVAWQLQTRTRMKVYAWMPTLAFQVKAPPEWRVHEWKDGKIEAASHVYQRLSPYHPEARRVVGEIYEDLAKYCSFDGLLFHDDALLTDFEDLSPSALPAVRSLWTNTEAFEEFHRDAKRRAAWGKAKTAKLVEFTDELTERVRNYRPDIKTARNMYALPILNPDSEEWLAQGFSEFLRHYDYVAVEAMPFMEEAADPNAWLLELAKRVSAEPRGLAQTVFEIQAQDWRTKTPVPTKTMIDQFDLLLKAGARHLGYYPDNLFEDQPRMLELEEIFYTPAKP